MAFKPGNKHGKGGAKPNAGRNPDWLREKCRAIFEKEKLAEFMGDVAAGKEFPQLATSEGEVLSLPPSLKDRRAATEWLAERGFGKVAQELQHTGQGGSRLVFVFPEDK